MSRVGDGQRECRPLVKADGVPRPAKPARQTCRIVGASPETTLVPGARKPTARGSQFCRAGFAGRGTARARSTEVTRSLPFRPETRSRVGLAARAREEVVRDLEIVAAPGAGERGIGRAHVADRAGQGGERSVAGLRTGRGEPALEGLQDGERVFEEGLL